GYFRSNSGVTVFWRIPVACLAIFDQTAAGVTVFWRIPVACLWRVWLFLIKQRRDCFLANTVAYLVVLG
ncbi:unnamed protein product, partial [Callosobruchus maculatus]